MKNISCHILTFNNENTIEKCLNSVNLPEIDIIVGDLGSTDKTLEICRKYFVNIQNLKFKDLSYARNHLVEMSYTDWQFYINPNEYLESGELLMGKDNCYNVFLIQNSVLNKETRLWNKKNNFKFKNPVYEYLDAPACQTLDIVLKSDGNIDVDVKLIDEWMKTCPFNSSPYYYKAFYYLSNNDLNMFLQMSEQYLFYEKNKSISYILMKYYRSLVIYKDNPKQALVEIYECISLKKEMAEFWCLLGDIFYIKMRDFKQAIIIYEKAIYAGKSRDIRDEFPVEPKKYEEYPMKRIKECQKLMEESRTVII